MAEQPEVSLLAASPETPEAPEALRRSIGSERNTTSVLDLMELVSRGQMSMVDLCSMVELRDSMQSGLPRAPGGAPGGEDEGSRALSWEDFQLEQDSSPQCGQEPCTGKKESGLFEQPLPVDAEARLFDDAYVFQQYKTKRITTDQLRLALDMREKSAEAAKESAASAHGSLAPPTRQKNAEVTAACFLMKGEPCPACIAGLCEKHGSLLAPLATSSNNVQKRERSREHSETSQGEEEEEGGGASPSSRSDGSSSDLEALPVTQAREPLRISLRGVDLNPDPDGEGSPRQRGACKQS